MQEIQVQLQALRDALGLKGGQSTLVGVAPMLAPVVDVSKLVELEAATLGRYIAPDARFHDDRTFRSEAYLLYDEQAAVAANNSILQLRNAGTLSNNVDVYLDALTFINPSGGIYHLRAHDAQLGSAAAAPVNKNQDGTSPLGWPQAQAAAGRHEASGVLPGALIAAFACVAGQDRRVEFSPPFRLPVGQGLVVNDATVNRAAAVLWEFRERRVGQAV